MTNQDHLILILARQQMHVTRPEDPTIFQCRQNSTEVFNFTAIIGPIYKFLCQK